MEVIKKVCVYCGSGPGAGEAYLKGARELGEELLRREIELVYGGASIGLMGELANTVLHGGGKVTGVMPVGLFRREVPHHDLTEMIEVSTMHERKAIMAGLADAFIAMPGGLGTAEELFEILTWSQLKIHSKPCGILNTAGYYNKLSEFLTHAVDQQFIRTQHESMIVWSDAPAGLLDKFAHYSPPTETKWLKLDGG
ncbi:MAG: TIGR00730 family Rossman fold protein [Gammaproteobacteria bacterium]|nr:TIGR00730 family Rossman fold protein [Gammaproteobacteria bacterium]